MAAPKLQLGHFCYLFFSLSELAHKQLFFCRLCYEHFKVLDIASLGIQKAMELHLEVNWEKCKQSHSFLQEGEVCT